VVNGCGAVPPVPISLVTEVDAWTKPSPVRSVCAFHGVQVPVHACAGFPEVPKPVPVLLGSTISVFSLVHQV
jgi:hypothetical protein